MYRLEKKALINEKLNCAFFFVTPFLVFSGLLQSQSLQEQRRVCGRRRERIQLHLRVRIHWFSLSR